MSEKIIQITEKISLRTDNLQYIERIERGNGEQAYHEDKYFPTLEQVFVDIFERVSKERLEQEDIEELKEIPKTVKETKEEIKEAIEEASNQL